MATTYLLMALFLMMAGAVMFSRAGDQKSSRFTQPLHSEQPVSSKTAQSDALAVWPFAPLPFMTDSEVKFFNRLQGAIPECYIFGQVQLSRLIECTDKSDAKFWINRINRMSADFVVVHPDAQTVLAVIELDDWSHDRPDRQRADTKKNKAIESAGLIMIRFDGRKLPKIQAMRAYIIKAIEAGGLQYPLESVVS